MIDFRKRALILTLAATVSVTGSFAADNYKNCLMDMEFNSIGNNKINLVLNTKKPYENKISPIRKDLSTYIIMLPEMDSRVSIPNISSINNFIESVDIRKMPYSNGAKGYTRILIKTNGVVSLNASTALYLPKTDNIPNLVSGDEKSDDILREKQEMEVINNKNRQVDDVKNINYLHKDNNSSTNTMPKPQESNAIEIDKDNLNSEENSEEESPISISEEQNPEYQTTNVQSDEIHQKYLLGLLVIFIIMTSIYAYIKTQDKLTNVMGEKINIDIDEEEPPKQQKNKNSTRKIKSAINKLDRLYSNSVRYLPESFNSDLNSITKNHDEEEELNIVDLDVLFKEKKVSFDDNMQEEPETTDLDDFLSDFAFDSEDLPNETPSALITNDDESIKFDEDLYQRLITDEQVKFSKKDIECFNILLQSEISDNVIDNIEQYVATNPIKPQSISPEKVLENFVIDYTISQGISFSPEDIDILKKLISVEIDNDFVNDLRTNSDKTAEMENEIQSESKSMKSSDVVTLSVKGMLPDLSEALIKQGDRPIVSDAKPEIIYYQEGYEVSKLSVNIDLPDLSKEINNKQAYISKPTADYETVDDSYKDSVEKLTVAGLPNLKDAVNNPEKYQQEKKEEYIPNEDALLEELLNVTFKPFDDGSSDDFEITNDFNDESENNVAEEVINIKEELSQFDNFEVLNSEETYVDYTNLDSDDFESIYNQNYVDLDNLNENKIDQVDAKAEKIEEKEKKYKVENIKEVNEPEKKVKTDGEKDDDKDKKVKKSDATFVPKNLKLSENKIPRLEQISKSTELIKTLNKINSDKKNVKTEKTDGSEPIKTMGVKIRQTDSTLSVKCIIDSISYEIVDTSKIENNLGFHLAKSSNGYAVLAFIENNLSVIKTYETVKSEKIQVRLSETLKDGTKRYLVKISTNKLIADFKNNKIEYVMDLC